MLPFGHLLIYCNSIVIDMDKIAILQFSVFHCNHNLFIIFEIIFTQSHVVAGQARICVFTTVCDVKLFIMRKHCVHYLVKQGNNVRLTDRSPVQSKHAENCLILVPSLSVGAFLIITVIIYFFWLAERIMSSCQSTICWQFMILQEETMTTPAQNSSFQNSVTCLKEPLSHLSSVKSGASNSDTSLKDNYW